MPLGVRLCEKWITILKLTVNYLSSNASLGEQFHGTAVLSTLTHWPRWVSADEHGHEPKFSDKLNYAPILKFLIEWGPSGNSLANGIT